MHRRSELSRFRLPHGSVVVSSDDSELLEWIGHRLPAAADPSEPLRAFHLRCEPDSWALVEEGRDFVWRGDRSTVAVHLLERLNQLACFTNPGLTVHSGLVADDAGSGIWIPAASGAGKSTLTAQLALSGLRYATDEAVTVGEGGTLIGWTKWLGLKQGSHAVLRTLAPAPDDPVQDERRWLVAPRSLGEEPAEGSVQARVIVLPEHRRGATTGLSEISRAEAVAEIVPQVFNLRNHGIAGVEVLASVVAGASVCLRLTYDDGWAASRVLIDLLRSERGAA